MIINTRNVNVQDFIESGITNTENRLKHLGLAADALLDPEDSFDRQIALLRYHYLTGERAALAFRTGDENFWRILRARLQPMILAYLTHEKFIQELDGDALEKKLKERMEIYRRRLATTEQFKDLFFELKEQGIARSPVVVQEAGAAAAEPQAEPVGLHDDGHHYDGRSGVADIQANVIKQLKEALKDQERTEKRLNKQLKEKDEQIYRHEQTITKLESKEQELLDKIEQLSTENLQLKISIDASTQERLKQDSTVPDDVQQSAAANEPSALPLVPEDLANASQEELLLKIESLERELENTSGAAYSAFMANSDLGIVILFILSAFKTNNLPRLGQEVGRSLKTYGVNSVFRIKTETSTDFFSPDPVSDTDKLLFKNHQGKGRVVDLGRNYLIFDDKTALLVKGMPQNDEERLGRLKDNLNTLMQAAETSAHLISLSHASEMQQQRIEQLLVRSNAVFNKLEANLQRNQATANALLKKAGADLRAQLNINPGEPRNTKLNAVIRNMDAGMEPLFKLEKLVDTAFIKNVARVVGAFKKDKS